MYFEIDVSVDANYVQCMPYGTSGGNLKIHIPAIMSKIPRGIPTTTPASLNKACYINASDCKPTVSSTITTQNFVTANAPHHAYDLPHFIFGDPLVIQPKTEDILTCRLFKEDLDVSKLLV